MLKLKKIPKYLIFILVVITISGCDRNNGKEDTLTPSKNNNLNRDKLINQTSSDKLIVIDTSRCSGCGKCSRVDSEHFTFDVNTGKAQVISQKNTGNSSVQAAISICRDFAINLK